MTRPYKTKKYLQKKTKTLINLYREGKKFYVVHALDSAPPPHAQKHEWEEAVLRQLDMRGTFFFNEMPFCDYKESLIRKENVSLDKKIHLWRLELLYSHIMKNLDYIDFLNNEKEQKPNDQRYKGVENN